MSIIDINEPGIRQQAQRVYDRVGEPAGESVQDSRPDAQPEWVDLTKEEQDAVIIEMHDDRRLYDYTDVQWFGSKSAVIESDTNPWLVDAEGEVIDLQEFCGEHPIPLWFNECHVCMYSPTVGVLLAMDNEQGIQRCDTCKEYPGDLDAAKALSEEHFNHSTVWFHGTN